MYVTVISDAVVLEGRIYMYEWSWSDFQWSNQQTLSVVYSSTSSSSYAENWEMDDLRTIGLDGDYLVGTNPYASHGDRPSIGMSQY